MSDEQLETLRALNRAFNSGGDWPSFYAPEAVLQMPAEWPDDSIYRGLGGLHAALDAWRSGFDEYHWREERLVDASDDRVVGLYYHRGRVKAGGAWIDQPIGCVFTFGGEKIIRLDGYFSWAEALRAVGIQDVEAYF